VERRRRCRHCRRDLVGAGKRQIFAREFGWQDLDHRLVLDPDLDHMERAAVAAKALPAFARRNGLDLVRVAGDAEREMGRAVAARLLPHKTRTIGAAWLQLGSGGIDLDPRSVLVELEREKAPRVGRKRHRGAAHQFR
jgi:hypothetical protein